MLISAGDNLDKMATEVDAAFIQGCNWDKHLSYAEPFIKAGKPVFIDKPIAGRIADLNKFEEYAAAGAVILGSSSLRYSYEIQEFNNKLESERGNIVHITTTVGVDEFNYAIHAVESMLGFVGEARPISTRFIGTANVENGECDSFFVKFDNGITGDYHVCTPKWQPSTATVITTQSTFPIKIDTSKIYQAMLEQILNLLEGKESIIAPVPALCDAVRIMLAGKKSKINGGEEILIANLTDEVLFDGDEFELFYAAQQKAAQKK